VSVVTTKSVTTKSSSRRGERRDKRRQEILDTASRLFTQLGYENVTLRAIAEELGYAHATLYRYFPDKSHLLAEICRETFDLLLSEFDTIAASFPDPAERLFQTSRGFVRFGLSHPQHFRIVFFGPDDRQGIRAGDYINQIGRPLFERVVEIFRASGLSEGDQLLDAHTWWSSIFGLTQVLITQGQLKNVPPPERVLERSIAIMWAGLRAAPSQPGQSIGVTSSGKAKTK
jgi:AcrR family transcriptional regulator